MGKVDGGLGGNVTEILLGVVAVLVVGLPLLALGADKVLPAFKNRPVAPSPMQLLARKHHLGGADVAEVEAAVEEGRAVRRPRLAAAAVELAGHVLSRDMWDKNLDRPRRLRRLHGWRRVLLLGVMVALLVGYLVVLVVVGQWVLPAVYAAAAVILLPLQHREWRRRQSAARAAVEANRPVAADVEGLA